MERISATIERATHELAVHLERTLSGLGVTQAEAHVLAHLAGNGPTPIGELHREFGHKRSTLTNVLDRLEDRGFVRRQVNRADRRSFVIHLTASGTRAGGRVTDALDELERAVRASDSERDLRGLEAVAQALATAVKR
jgi:DNA-binding MarR family transcriptional regulator